MNELAKQGFELGRDIKAKGLEHSARIQINQILENHYTYRDKLHCILELSSLVNKSIPIIFLKEEDNKNMYMFLLGLINGLNKAIDEVVTVKEASSIVGKDVSSINRAISSGKLVEGIDCRKSGTTWLIDKESLLKVFKIVEK